MAGGVDGSDARIAKEEALLNVNAPRMDIAMRVEVEMPCHSRECF